MLAPKMNLYMYSHHNRCFTDCSHKSRSPIPLSSFRIQLSVDDKTTTKTMNTCFSFLFIVTIILQFNSLPPLIFAYIPSSSSSFNNVSLISLPPPSRNVNQILEDVLRAISASQNWDSDDVRVSRLDARSARFGSAQRYEFRVRFGKAHLFFRLSDEVGSWKKLRNGRSDLGSLVDRVGSSAKLDAFKVEGPFELQVGGNDQLSLSLPLSPSISGLKRILVGEGITVEITRAREVSLFHASGFVSALNMSHLINKEKTEFWPLWHSRCSALLPIQIFGSALVVAYQTRNPNAYIESKFSSKETIKLLPEKCYSNRIYKKQACPINSLSSKIAVVKRIMGGLGDRIRQDRLLDHIKVTTKASTIINFQLELERDIRRNDAIQGMLADWRTSPTTERVLFKVVARVEGKRLKPLKIKIERPFIIADSSAWSNLMSNISFTNFPSILVPQEALTLDVKW